MVRCSRIILRAAAFAGFSSDGHSLPWQCAQVTPREFAMKAMTGMS
jgi:hypothetical protein